MYLKKCSRSFSQCDGMLGNVASKSIVGNATSFHLRKRVTRVAAQHVEREPAGAGHLDPMPVLRESAHAIEIRIPVSNSFSRFCSRLMSTSFGA